MVSEKEGDEKVNQKPSEIITEFLNFLESAKNEYESAYADVGAEDRKEQTFMHDIEFAQNEDDLYEIAERCQKSRRARRSAKDKTLLYEHIMNFYTYEKNQSLIKSLRRLQNEQITREKYLFGNREFKNRVE